MDVGQLGNRIAHLVVNRSLAHLATLDVGNGDTQRKRHGRGRQHFIAVGDQQQQVGTPRGQSVGQAEDRDADRLRHAGIGIGAEQALYPRLDRKPFAFDLGNGGAEFGREMRPEG